MLVLEKQKARIGQGGGSISDQNYIFRCVCLVSARHRGGNNVGCALRNPKFDGTKVLREE